MNRCRFGIFICVAAALLVSGCGSKDAKTSVEPQLSSPTAYKDGIYTGQSQPDDRGAVGKVVITVQQGKIVKAEYQGLQKDGKVKDAEYGKTNGKIENQEMYDKAQKAVKAAASYGPKLVETQSVGKVDAVSGATVSYKQFVEAVGLALKNAK